MHKSRGHNNLVGKRQPLSVIRGPHSFIRLQKVVIHTFVLLTVKQVEEFRIQWPGRFFTGGVSLALV